MNASRLINPSRSFVTLPVFVGQSAGPWPPTTAQVLHTFRFETDSILHSVNMQVQFSSAITANPMELALGVALDSLAGQDMQASANSCMLYAQVTNGDSAGPTTVKQVVPFTQRVDTGAMLVKAGTQLTVASLVNAIDGFSIDGSVSFSYNTLSEWVNFREPRVGVAR